MEELLTYVTGISHVGIAVPDIAAAAAQYELLGFKEHSAGVIMEEAHGVQSKMMSNAAYTIELVAPLEDGKESPVDTYIATKPYKMYHISYKVSDFDAQVALLKKNKFVMIDEPKISQSSGGKRIVFMFNRKLGIVELTED